MARPSRISADQILEVARCLFLERGLDVPTAEIARHAGVSEGSIFNRFPTKQHLFVAAMGADQAPAWVEDLRLRPEAVDIRSALVEIILAGIAFFRDHLPRIMLLWSSRDLAAEEKLSCCQLAKNGPQQALEALTGFIEREVERKLLRVAYPEVLARLLLGSIANFVFLETVGVEARGPLSSDEYADQVASILLTGVAGETVSVDE